MPILELQNVSLQFGSRTALQNISVSVSAGDYIGIVGPNGAGKSTLLRVLLGTLTPTTGRRIVQPGLRFGYVAQDPLLKRDFSLSVQEVLQMSMPRLFPFFWGRTTHTQDLYIQHLASVELDASFLQRRFSDLSGGQQQRVLIVRALLHSPDMLLFDEPFSATDHQTRQRIYDLLARLNADHGITILFVSHEIERITEHCHSVWCLDVTLHHGCHPLTFLEQGVSPSCQSSTESRRTRPIHHHHQI